MRYLKPQTVHPRIEYLGEQEMCVYLLKGKEYMLIEGGMSYIVPAMLRQFRERGIDPSRISRLLILHSHFDHCGIAPFFKRMLPRLKILASPRSQDLFQKEKVVQFIRERNREMLKSLAMEKEAAELGLDFDRIAVDEIVQEGDLVDLGEGIQVRIIEMPGHSSCSLAAYGGSLSALFPSDTAGIPGEGNEIFPAGGEDYILYQKSLAKLLPLRVEILCAARNGVFEGEEARSFIARALEGTEKMRRDVILRFEGLEDREAALVRFARERSQAMKTRDVPWEIALALTKKMVDNILNTRDE